MKNSYILCLAALLTSCSDGTMVIDDVSKNQEKVVISDYSKRYNITLTITGETDGSFIIFGIPFGKGKINKTYMPDSYVDTVRLDYEPITAKKGKLIIKYDY